MRRRLEYNLDQYAEPASGSPESKLFGGFVLPGALIFWGLAEIVTRKAMSRVGMLHGVDAMFWGGFKVLVGCFCHIHYYWTVSERFWRYSRLAKVVLLVLFLLLAVAYAVWAFAA